MGGSHKDPLHLNPTNMNELQLDAYNHDGKYRGIICFINKTATYESTTGDFSWDIINCLQHLRVIGYHLEIGDIPINYKKP